MKPLKPAVLIIAILLFSITLTAQERLGEVIVIVFANLTCESSYEEVKEFTDDYSRHELTMMFWGPPGGLCRQALFVFSVNTISINELTDILLDDDRVVIAQHDTASFRARQLVIKLSDNLTESDFLERYADYGLNGSAMIPDYYGVIEDTRIYCFDDTVIYPADFVALLRSDNEVTEVDFFIGWVDGSILVSLTGLYGNELDVFFNDYSYIEFRQLSTFYSARFDCILHNEFDVLYEFLNDERVNTAELNFWMPLYSGYPCMPKKPGGPIVNLIDESVAAVLNYSVFPNPAKQSDITFKLENTDDKNRQITESNISIFNLKGQLIKNASINEDTYVWDRRDNNNREVPSGVYFFRINSEEVSQTGRVLIIK